MDYNDVRSEKEKTYNDGYKEGYSEGFHDCLDSLWESVIKPVAILVLTDKK